MSLKDLEEFLNEGNDKQEEPKFDPEKEKQDWLESVQKLYEDVNGWLKPLSDKSMVTISYDKIKLEEEELGEYEVNRMIIHIKGQRVILEPIGTLLIGSKGRIDMIGNYGTVKFTWVDKRLTKPRVTVRFFESEEQLREATGKKPEKPKPIEWEWKIMTSAPNVQYLPLNEETFSDSLLSVIRNG